MANDGEPKWERVEPPNFDDEEVKRPTGKLEMDETPLPPEIVREEVKHLFNLENQLSELLKDAPAEVVSNDHNIEHSDYQDSFVDYQAPFSGIGRNWMEFGHLKKNPYSYNLGFSTPFQLLIRLHTDKDTQAEAEKLKKENPHAAYDTRFYFDENGNSKIISAIPSEINIPAARILGEKGPHVTLVNSPITASKIEMAGSALQHMINRIKPPEAKAVPSSDDS